MQIIIPEKLKLFFKNNKKRLIAAAVFFIVSIIVYLLVNAIPLIKELGNGKLFFSRGHLFIYTSNEKSCFDFCYPERRIYNFVSVIDVNSPSIGGENDELQTQRETCRFHYDRDAFDFENIKIVYRKGGYWYKLKLNDSGLGCRLNGYVYRNVVNSDIDLSGIKESFVNYDCDKEDDAEEIYQKSEYILSSSMFNKSNIKLHKYPSKNDLCKYVKWKDTGDIDNCFTIYNQILKENCGGFNYTDNNIIKPENPPLNNSEQPENDMNTPRVMMWSGKVNQHWDLELGQWMTDSDGVSGAGIDVLSYCKKFYPKTIAFEKYKLETTNTWRDSGNENSYESTRMSYRCVQGK